jgi:hypothetical protein
VGIAFHLEEEGNHCSNEIMGSVAVFNSVNHKTSADVAGSFCKGWFLRHIQDDVIVYNEN